MVQAKLTVRVPRELLDNFRRYAADNNTTMTNLIREFLIQIPVSGSLEKAPIVKRVSGVLPQSLSKEDYNDHLEQKFGG
jgi:hypothetical protein